MAKQIDSFRGPYSFLSNFYECSVEFLGVKYRSAEAAFQSQKCLYVDDKVLFNNMSANEAKRFGKRVRLRRDWEEVKDYFMYRVVRSKFEQNEYLKNLLLNTGDIFLIEGNTWGDRYWGMVDGVGKNKLGLTLMRVRDELRNGKLWISDEYANLSELNIDGEI